MLNGLLVFLIGALILVVILVVCKNSSSTSWN